MQFQTGPLIQQKRSSELLRCLIAITIHLSNWILLSQNPNLGRRRFCPEIKRSKDQLNHLKLRINLPQTTKATNPTSLARLTKTTSQTLKKKVQPALKR